MSGNRYRISDLLRELDFNDAVSNPSLLSSVFEEEPVPLDVFVSDKKFLGNPPLSEVQFEAVKYAERIYQPELYPLMEKEFGSYWAPIRMVNFITLQWPKGSGKDHIARIIGLRIAYLLLCLRNPLEYFGLPSQDTIHLLNVASSAPQASEAYFMPITRAVGRGWFKDKCVAKPGSGVISWKKNVEQISGHSDAEAQEGLNLILGVADEIDAFKTAAELARFHGKSAREPTRSAEAILKLLRSSAVSRFPRTFKNVRLSYPRYLGSHIQKLTESARADIEELGEKSTHYVSGPLPLWEVNPLIPGKEVFADEYRDDPVNARARYECKPELSTDSYFRNMDVFRAAISAPEQPISVDYGITSVRSQLTGEVVETWEPSFTYAPDFVPISGANYCLHGDLAIVADRAGVAMSHVVSYEEGQDEIIRESGEVISVPSWKPVVKVDFVIAFEADFRTIPPREIQIRWVRSLAFDLYKRGFNIVSLTYDGFQSKDSMQILQLHGIESSRVSTDISEDPWKTLRDLANDGRLSFPRSDLLLEELRHLGRYNGKVDHPSGKSKDLADAFACSVFGAVAQGGEESPEGEISERGVAGFYVGPNMLSSLHEFSQTDFVVGDPDSIAFW
jgi:hypothetical protein